MTRIVVLGCGGGGWSGVDLDGVLSGDGELQEVVLGEAYGVHRDSVQVQKTLVVWVLIFVEESRVPHRHIENTARPCVGPDVILFDLPLR